MKIDFHTHGKLTKKLPFSKEYTMLMFKEAKKAGLDAICLTEHFNTEGYIDLYRFLKNNYPLCGDAFIAEGLLVFPGLEVDIAEGGHILIIGAIDTILYQHNLLRSYGEEGSFLPLKNLLDMTKDCALITGAAHPLREDSNIPLIAAETLKRLTFIDFNGKDYIYQGDEGKDALLFLSKQLGLPIIAGSDTHCFLQYGCVYNEFPHCDTIQALMNCINERSFNTVVSEQAGHNVSSASMLKSALKKIDVLGGDYLSILMD